MTRPLILIAFCAFCTTSRGEERLSPWSVITELPASGKTTLTTSFSRAAIPAWTLIGASTALLYHYDEEILKDFQYYGRQTGIGNEDKTKTIVQAGPYPLLRLPSDTGSALYFLGDGWTHFAIAGGFLANGHFGTNNRAWNTGLEIAHGMVVSTFFSQALKRSTGREAPTDQSEERGRWRPFPSTYAYQQNTPKYDAFPSGHIMTATLTFTIINENYPEYWKYTVPIGVLWVSALGYQMVNNGVHWASDYPLGIAMGYHIGKIASRLSDRADMAKPADPSFSLFPILHPDFPGLFLQASF